MVFQTLDRRRQPRSGPGDLPRHHLDGMILGMYEEMPGLSLHLEQAARLFGLPISTCNVVLEELVKQRRLRRAPDGQYKRLTTDWVE